MINKDGMKFIALLCLHLIVSLGAIGLGIEWISKGRFWLIVGVPSVIVGLMGILFYLLAFWSYFKNKFGH